MTDDTTLGPVDFYLVEFPEHATSAPVATQLAASLDRGIVRLFDVAGVRKDAEGTVGRVELTADAPGLGGFEQFVDAASGLFDEADLRQAGEILEPGMSGLLIAVENTWARGIVAAVDAAAGRVVASERIPAHDVIEALDALESVR